MGMARWAVTIIISTFITMVLIYVVKHGAIRFNVPIAKDIAEGI